MKGLLLRELYNGKTLGKTLIGIEIFCGGFSFLLKSNTYSVMMAMIFCASFLLGSISQEEKGGWAFLLETPVCRRQLVLEKYLYSFLTEVLLVTVNGLVGVAVTIYLELSWFDLKFMLLIAAAYYFYSSAVLFPLAFRFGTEKIRYLILFICLVPALIFVALLALVGDGLQAIGEDGAFLAAGIALGISCFAWLGSYFLSERIFQKREIP